MTTPTPATSVWLLVAGTTVLAAAAAADVLPWLLIAVAGALAIWVGIFAARG